MKEQIIWLMEYLSIGLISVYLTAVVHLIRAEIKGYAACDWWNKFKSGVGKVPISSYIFGLMIWPIRLAEFIVVIPDLYETYELKTKN